MKPRQVIQPGTISLRHIVRDPAAAAPTLLYTNEIVNPSFEAGVAGWSFYSGAGAAVTPATLEAKSDIPARAPAGKNYMLISGTNTDTIVRNLGAVETVGHPVVAGSRYYVRMAVSRIVGPSQLSMSYAQNGPGSLPFAVTAISGAPGNTTSTTPATVLEGYIDVPSGVSTVHLVLQGNVAGGVTYSMAVDAVMMVKLASSTDTARPAYFDGESSAAGWNGVPHLSTSYLMSSAKALLGSGMTGYKRGLNGVTGWQGGQIERKLGDTGAFTLTFPNASGEDGKLHRERFAIITDKNYRPGDEWVEVWRNDGELLFVGTPTQARVTSTAVELSGYDGAWLLKKQRDTAAAFNFGGPAEILRDYCSAWRVRTAEDFTDGAPAMTTSTSTQTTADGRFTYINATSGAGGAVLTSATTTAEVQTVATATATPLSAAVRFEVEFEVLAWPDFQSITLAGPGGSLSLASRTDYSLINGPVPTRTERFKPGAVIRMAFEVRGRWAFGYLNGELVTTAPNSNLGSTSITQAPARLIAFPGVSIRVRRMLFRERSAYMRAPISDYSLPGAPPASGLIGTFWDDNTIKLGQSGTSWNANQFMPTLTPRARQMFGSMSMTPGDPPAWRPAAVQPTAFSARFVGAIYLPLGNYDVALRTTAVDDRIRVWVGPTSFDRQYIADFWGTVSGSHTVTGNWLKAGSDPASAPAGASGLLVGQKSGWYPIVIEYWQDLGAGGFQLEMTRSDAVGTWAPVGSTTTFVSPASDTVKLSPIGIVDQQARYDSHFEQLRATAEMFGYQWTVEPRSLESGSFPGLVRYAGRLGRDTEKVLDNSEAVGLSQEINAEDVVDSQIIDAAGLSDPNNQAQLTYEALNYGNLGAHVFMHSDQDSLADITDPTLLEQRAASLGVLRDSAWSQVSAQSRGQRESLDSLPLKGVLAEFKWEPGDGVRLNLPEISLVDQTPRQIAGVQWPILPNGLGAPSVGFRQRPYGLRQTLDRLVRQVSVGQRNYQGQLMTIQGEYARSAVATGSYSRCPWPSDPNKVIKAMLHVPFKSDLSPWTIEINDVSTGIAVSAVGSYDITAYVGPNPGNRTYCYVRLTGGTGNYEAMLVLTYLA